MANGTSMLLAYYTFLWRRLHRRLISSSLVGSRVRAAEKNKNLQEQELNIRRISKRRDPPFFFFFSCHSPCLARGGISCCCYCWFFFSPHRAMNPHFLSCYCFSCSCWSLCYLGVGVCEERRVGGIAFDAHCYYF